MTYEDVKKDVEAAHAIFDLCGIDETTRSGGPNSLRARAMAMAQKLGIEITDQQLLDRLNQRRVK